MTKLEIAVSLLSMVRGGRGNAEELRDIDIENAFKSAQKILERATK